MSHPFRTKPEILRSYLDNMAKYEARIQKLKRNKRILAIARLTTVITGSGICLYFWPSAWIVFSTVILFSFFFVFLVFRDTDKTEAIKNDERLIAINRHEVDALQHNLKRYEDGQLFADTAHPYAADLDLFGPSSLFQYLSRCHSHQSKKLLADFLKEPPPVSVIKEKQESADELSEKQSYCQNFQSAAMENPLTDQAEKKLTRWMDASSAGFQQSFWKWFQNIYPFIPVFVFIICISDNISISYFLYCLIGFYILSILISRKISGVLELLLNLEPETEILYKQFLLIENEKFRSGFLHKLQSRLKPPGDKTTSEAIGELHGILKKNDWRSNLLVNLILQIFFVWDLRLIILLNEWKRRYNQPFRNWFGVIAEMEVAISQASLVHNEPEWCFPDVDEFYFHFLAEGIGHPLIPAASRVNSDFELDGTGKIALVTGSNMAGKSTFLRSLGVNTVLARTGFPVCARKMNLGDVKLISSMRVSDNLAENTSTFYAELKKLQYIIESVKRKEKVFILLDEVLRGTNSTDRHKGAKALVRQLMQSGAVAVMATHDTELAHSESANPNVFNYHFEGKITDEELSFDYKIKSGVSESLNATTLMKKIGIHFQD